MSSQKYWNAGLVFQRMKREEFKTEEKCDHVLFNIPCQMSKRIQKNTRRDSLQNEIREEKIAFVFYKMHINELKVFRRNIKKS